ncbi:MAG: hypothetical protein RLZZ623_967 [Actinomycetota bacterium]
MTRLAIIGTGYVGLTTGACFAHLGHDVVCADVDADKVAMLNRGEIPIVEHRLDELVNRGLKRGNLRFVVGAANAVADCEIAFLCVPTPQGADGSADLTYVEAASREIAELLPYEAIVVNKSTVPVGSTKVVERVLRRPDVRVVSNPEFLREGSAVDDFLKPDRIVVGSDDRAAAIAVGALYESIRPQVIVTDPASAETIKYAANAFLATKLSFINAIAAICEGVGADVNDVVVGMGYDKRIGTEFLRPGPGWGGSCFDGAETLIVRDAFGTRLIRFDQLDGQQLNGLDGLEVLSWAEGQIIPEFQRALAITTRPYNDDMVTMRTKMGRRLTVTADHPMIVRTGDDVITVKLAGDLTTDDWLPISLGSPLADSIVEHAPILEAIALRPHRLPDSVWGASESAKQALLRGLWAGDGSWSLLNGGPSVALEYGTVSAELADGMLRLLGELGIVARHKIARTTKSTVDTHWLIISGADQIEDALWILEPHERETVLNQIAQQSKRIAPTGFRRDRKGTAWVRIADVSRRSAEQTVYSVEVARNHTVVTTGGLVAHNCFPKDSRALLKIANDAGYRFDLLAGVIAVNDEQFDRVTDKIAAGAGGNLEGKSVAVWGLTFKARTDDLRDSPAIAIIERLLQRGASVKAYDPTVAAFKPGVPEGITVSTDPYEATAGADVLAVLTEWDDFRWLEPDKVASVMKGRHVVDGRNLIDRSDWHRSGFTTDGIGR